MKQHLIILNGSDADELERAVNLALNDLLQDKSFKRVVNMKFTESSTPFKGDSGGEFVSTSLHAYIVYEYI